jgi:hypothetical protein
MADDLHPSDGLTGNPILDRFNLNFDTPEKMTANAEAARVTYERFNRGVSIPSIRPSDLRQLWEAARRLNAEHPPQPEGAVGLSVFAALGVEAACESPEQWVPITLRCQLMSALIERGVLKDLLKGEELDEKVIRAASTLPCDKNDLGEAMIPLAFAKLSPDEVAKAKEEMRAAGYDPDQPPIDTKFLDWLSNHC